MIICKIRFKILELVLDEIHFQIDFTKKFRQKIVVPSTLLYFLSMNYFRENNLAGFFRENDQYEMQVEL